MGFYYCFHLHGNFALIAHVIVHLFVNCALHSIASPFPGFYLHCDWDHLE